MNTVLFIPPPREPKLGGEKYIVFVYYFISLREEYEDAPNT